MCIVSRKGFSEEVALKPKLGCQETCIEIGGSGGRHLVEGTASAKALR